MQCLLSFAITFKTLFTNRYFKHFNPTRYSPLMALAVATANNFEGSIN